MTRLNHEENKSLKKAIALLGEATNNNTEAKRMQRSPADYRCGRREDDRWEEIHPNFTNRPMAACDC
jgi:hypothetical protein